MKIKPDGRRQAVVSLPALSLLPPSSPSSGAPRRATVHRHRVFPQSHPSPTVGAEPGDAAPAVADPVSPAAQASSSNNVPKGSTALACGSPPFQLQAWYRTFPQVSLVIYFLSRFNLTHFYSDLQLKWISHI